MRTMRAHSLRMRAMLREISSQRVFGHRRIDFVPARFRAQAHRICHSAVFREMSHSFIAFLSSMTIITNSSLCIPSRWTCLNQFPHWPKGEIYRRYAVSRAMLLLAWCRINPKAGSPAYHCHRSSPCRHGLLASLSVSVEFGS